MGLLNEAKYRLAQRAYRIAVEKTYRTTHADPYDRNASDIAFSRYWADREIVKDAGARAGRTLSEVRARMAYITSVTESKMARRASART